MCPFPLVPAEKPTRLPVKSKYPSWFSVWFISWVLCFFHRNSSLILCWDREPLAVHRQPPHPLKILLLYRPDTHNDAFTFDLLTCDFRPAQLPPPRPRATSSRRQHQPVKSRPSQLLGQALLPARIHPIHRLATKNLASAVDQLPALSSVSWEDWPCLVA